MVSAKDFYNSLLRCLATQELLPPHTIPSYYDFSIRYQDKQNKQTKKKKNTVFSWEQLTVLLNLPVLQLSLILCSSADSLKHCHIPSTWYTFT
jgi:hypothetical protein